MKNNKITVFLLGISFYYSISGYVLASNEEKVCIHEECNVHVSNMGRRHNTTIEIIEAVSDLFGSLVETCGKIDWSKCTCCSKTKYEESENVKLPSLRNRSIDNIINNEEEDIINHEEDKKEKNEEESEEEEINTKEGLGFFDNLDAN